MLLAAALLFTAAPPAPQPATAVVAVARARILRPVQVTQAGQLTPGRSATLNTHTSPRRDGALVVDCY
jgi:hypothetical protein